MSATAALLGRRARARSAPKRLRCNDVGAYPKNAPRQRGRDGAEVGVSAQHQMRAAHGACAVCTRTSRPVLVAQAPRNSRRCPRRRSRRRAPDPCVYFSG